MPTHHHPPSPADDPAPPHQLLAAADTWCRNLLHPRPTKLPQLHDDVDDIAVQRAANGDRSITLNRAELDAAWRILEGRHLSAPRIAERLGVTPRTVVRWRQGHTRPVARRTVGVLAARRGLAA